MKLRICIEDKIYIEDGNKYKILEEIHHDKNIDGFIFYFK